MVVNREWLYNYLMEEFANPIGVCSLMANIQAESGYISHNLQNTFNRKYNISDIEYTNKVDNGEISKTEFCKDGSGYGLCQWTWHTRKEGLYKMCYENNTSIADVTCQLRFMLKELKEYGLWNEIKNASNSYDITKLIMVKYENPFDKSEEAIMYRFGLCQILLGSLTEGIEFKEESAVVTKYYIQFGAFRKEDNAINFIKRYEDKLKNILNNECFVYKDSTWFKVQSLVGSDRDLCTKKIKELRSIGYDVLLTYR